METASVVAENGFPLVCSGGDGHFDERLTGTPTSETQYTAYDNWAKRVYMVPDTHFLDSIEFVSQPHLSITRSGDQLLLSWPASPVAFILQSADSVFPAPSWQPVPTPPVAIGDQQSVTIKPEAKATFYRLSLGY